jgi:hypothetical protein
VLQHVLPSQHCHESCKHQAKLFQTEALGVQDIVWIRSSASCRQPAWPRRSTMQA